MDAKTLVRVVSDIQDNEGLYLETKYEAIKALCEIFKQTNKEVA